jgi:hypothetical protein
MVNIVVRLTYLTSLFIYSTQRNSPIKLVAGYFISKNIASINQQFSEAKVFFCFWNNAKLQGSRWDLCIYDLRGKILKFHEGTGSLK